MTEHAIPPITDPMGKGWAHLDRARILVDDKHALMYEGDFNSLPEYSASIPTGVYEGKMWRRHNGLFDPRCKPEERKWMLAWYGPSADPNKCSVNFREVIFL